MGFLTLVSNKLNCGGDPIPGSVAHGMNLDLEIARPSSGF